MQRVGDGRSSRMSPWTNRAPSGHHLAPADRQVVEDRDLSPAAEQRARQMRSDEAGAARDQGVRERRHGTAYAEACAATPGQ